MSDEPLNPGIADLVRYLQAQGFDTTDSGDGVTNIGMEGMLPFRHVVVPCGAGMLIRRAADLAQAARRYGLDVKPQGEGGWYVQAMYDPVNDSGVLMLAET